MAAQLLSLRLLVALLACTVADPAPGRIPKVYNALITSNQNLEPSKAYPVYQPVLHDAFAFSYQPAVFYGGDLINNGLLPVAAPLPKVSLPKETTATAKPEPAADAPTEAPVTSPSSTEAQPPPEPSRSEPKGDSTPAPPLPPNTQSPIPLNEFGLPPQVLPLGHIDPLYNALPQFSPFTYRYPGLRFYDPYDPFGFSPYTSFPLYRPVTNLLGPSFPGHSLPVVANKEVVTTDAEPSSEKSAQTPPSEPSDLNILNYSSKDPAIPNVPPPPLPQGGLKSDKSE